jgi:hypothetical protein
VIPSMRVNGRELNKKTPGRNIRATLKRLGLERPGLGWYEATRHTFASQWGPLRRLHREAQGDPRPLLRGRHRALHAPPDGSLRGAGAGRDPVRSPGCARPESRRMGPNWGHGRPTPRATCGNCDEKDRSGPVSRGLESVITPACGWCATVLIPSGNASAVRMEASAKATPFARNLGPQ